jgi:DNA-directed RNA polymerase subunit M/transcription elongation factor TFIIS
MRFCKDCGSYLSRTPKGLWCPKCKKHIPSKPTVKTRNVKKNSQAIYVVGKPKHDYARSSQVCPKCGNEETFHWYSTISGEHAGIRRERTIEHFKCAKCSHSWSKSS